MPRSERAINLGLVAGIAVAGLAYRLVVSQHLEQTALLFIGIPAILAVVVAATPRAKSVTGGIMKAITIALLLSGPFLGEGFICILMAAPLFYLVGAIVGLIIASAKRHGKSTMVSCLVLVGLLPMSSEGLHPRLSFNREEAVQASRMINASADMVEQALSRSPRTDLPLPFYLRLGFPRAVEAHGSGLNPGDLRTIHFAGGEGHPGDLVMKLVEHPPGHLRFVAVADKSKVSHWLDWEAADVDWKVVDASHTQVTWTLHYRRLLDPAWYFRPWERYATRLAADYLIQANATPLPANTKPQVQP
jgi:hypothetical protein